MRWSISESCFIWACVCNQISNLESHQKNQRLNVLLHKWHYHWSILSDVGRWTSLFLAGFWKLPNCLCNMASTIIHCKGLQRLFIVTFVQKTAFSLVKSRLALGSPGCSVVRVSPCWTVNMAKTRKKGCWMPLVIKSIDEILFHTRPGKRNNLSRQSFA